MKLVINYARPQSGAKDSEIFGMDVAINNFLRAFLRHGRQETFFFLPDSEESIAALRNLAQEAGADFARCAWLMPQAPKETLCDVDLLFRPDPNLGDHPWKRLQLPPPGFALGSMVHTLSGERVAEALANYLIAPTQAGDAIICPSTAIRDAVASLWQIQTEYYNARFAGNSTCPVDLPVIPLGIDTNRFLNITTPEKRASQRAALGIAEDEVVILYVGRLSYATKAHPLPLFQAAEIAAQRCKQKLRLVLYGFFKPDMMEPDFRDAASDYCRSLKVDFVLNNDPRFPDGLWAAGDIFTSLIDNIQESFGLTPIEAMAGGLPAVISDFDGYRDGVRHGQDGFLVPTCAPPPGTNLDVAAHYFNQRNYGDYLIRNNQSVAVDAQMAAAAFVLLAEDRPRRLIMGQSGRERAMTRYDWAAVIRAYEDLWEQQAEKRKSAQRHVPQDWPAVHPGFPDPSTMFAGFPSSHLSLQDGFELSGDEDDLHRVRRHRMNTFGIDMLLDPARMVALLKCIKSASDGGAAVFAAQMDAGDSSRVLRTLAWLMKMGLIRKK